MYIEYETWIDGETAIKEIDGQYSHSILQSLPRDIVIDT